MPCPGHNVIGIVSEDTRISGIDHVGIVSQKNTADGESPCRRSK